MSPRSRLWPSAHLGVSPLLALSLGVLLACACGAKTDTRLPTDDDFRAVQHAEASAERGHRRATAPASACPDACAGAGDVCAAATAICELARETEDLDLRARCRAARDRCAEATARSEARCGCGADPVEP